MLKADVLGQFIRIIVLLNRGQALCTMRSWYYSYMEKQLAKNSNVKKTKSRLNKWIVAILVFIACYSISLFVPVVRNFTYYPVKKIQCGWSQLYYGNGFFGTYRYYESNVPSTLTAPDRLFCGSAEAESEGYIRG